MKRPSKPIALDLWQPSTVDVTPKFYVKVKRASQETVNSKGGLASEASIQTLEFKIRPPHELFDSAQPQRASPLRGTSRSLPVQNLQAFGGFGQLTSVTPAH